MLRIVLVVTLPLLGIAMLSTLDAVWRERARFDEQLLQTARAMAVALDGEIARIEHAVRLMADALDLGAVVTDGELRRMAGREADGPALALVLDREGRRVVEGDAWLDRMPGEIILDHRFMEAVQAAPRTLLSDVLSLPGGAFAVAAARPLEAVQPTSLIAVLVPSSRLGQVLGSDNLPPGWVAAVVDRQGRLAARSRAEEQFLGRLATPGVRAMLAGAESSVSPYLITLDGMRSTAAAARAPRSGYAVVIAAPAPTALQDLRAVLGRPAMGGVLLILAAIWGASRVTAHVLAGIAALAPGAPAAASGVRELDDAAARLRAAEAAQASAMQRLEESEARYRIATEAFAGGIYEYRPSDGVVIRSQGHLAIIGEESEEPVRQWWLGRIHAEDRPRVMEALARLDAGALERCELEYRVRHRRGHYIWVWQRSIAARDAEGRLQRIVGCVADISAERAARDAEALIAREMEHRVKNSFNLVISLVGLTAARRPEAAAFAAELQDRILALTAAHDLIHGTAEGTTLHALIRLMAAAYEASEGERRILPHGDDVPLRPALVPQFGLVLHEWLTNSAKYGALSVPEGRLHLTLRHAGTELLLEWEESGGPPVPGPPEKLGFGSVLLASTIQGLGARLEREWRREGLRLTLALPLDQLGEPAGVTPARA